MGTVFAWAVMGIAMTIPKAIATRINHATNFVSMSNHPRIPRFLVS